MLLRPTQPPFIFETTGVTQGVYATHMCVITSFKCAHMKVRGRAQLIVNVVYTNLHIISTAQCTGQCKLIRLVIVQVSAENYIASKMFDFSAVPKKMVS